MSTIRLWIRQDVETGPDGVERTLKPKALASDATKGPGPGRVVDVEASSADEARKVYALSLDTITDAPPKGRAALAHWGEVRAARDRVKPVKASSKKAKA